MRLFIIKLLILSTISTGVLWIFNHIYQIYYKYCVSKNNDNIHFLKKKNG